MARTIILILTAVCLLFGTARAEEPRASGTAEEIESLLAGMTLHEKVCQLFFVRPEQFSRLKSAYERSSKLTAAFRRFPVGGVILFAQNIRAKKITSLNESMQEAALSVNGIGLLIGADEEGGGVSRVANKLKLPQKQPAASKVADAAQAYLSGLTIAQYLTGYGFNVNFAPVADIRTDVPRAEIVQRSYGRDPEDVAAKVEQFILGSREGGIINVVKHFPGHGAVSGNTHSGIGRSERTADDWRGAEFLPFRAGIGAGAGFVMLSHQLAVNVDPDRPASLSPTVVGLLRNELGFQGVIITDSLGMGAIHDRYSSGESCLLALEAGVDMLLLPYNFTNAYRGVMSALESGRLTEARIDESVRRILTLKASMGLIPAIPAETR